MLPRLLLAAVIVPAPAAGVLLAAGDLEGRELLAADEADSDALAMILRLRGDSRASLDHVVVAEDAPGRVVLRVVHRGFDGKQIWGLVLDDRRRERKEIRGTPAILPAGGAAVELAFALDPRLPVGSHFDSAFLRLNVARPGRGAEFTRLFRFPKSWRVEPSPESLVVRVVPKPIGAAGRLGERAPGSARPPVRVLTPGGPYVLQGRTQATGAERGPGLPFVRSLSGAPTDGSAATTIVERAALAPRPATSGGSRVRPSVSGARTATHLVRDLGRASPGPAIRALPAGATRLLDPSRFDFGVRPEDRERGAAGPGPFAFELLGALRAEDEVDLRREEILGLFPIVYRDRNSDSGFFYFLPAAYHLAWDPDAGPARGLGLRMLYDAASAGRETGNVHLAVRLDSGVDAADVDLARQLLQAHARRLGRPFTELRPLPIPVPPEVTLAGDLQHQYDIPPERVSVHAIADALAALELSLTTDVVTKENLQLALLEDVGINGRLVFQPDGGALAPQEIPIRIRLADRGTFGRFVWKRGEPLRNRTPYPLRLRYLHALLLQDGEPVVYSWALAGALVPPAAALELDASGIPPWLDTGAKRLWLDYAVATDCDPCDERVVTEITGGVSRLHARQVNLHTLSPLADTGAYQISVVVRSRYLDPRSREMRDAPALVVKEDDRSYVLATVFPGDRRLGETLPGDPLLEYSLEVVMPDGTEHRSTAWLPSDDLEVVLGTRQIRDALGFLPGADGDERR